MREQSLKQSLILSAGLTALYAAFIFLTSDISLVETLISLPLFFVILFFTMRATNRITSALTRRFGPKPKEPPPPPEPSSERPDHAQRRREARRRRGRRSRARRA